ncbi:hypothetical protein [Curtobacterium sp. MCBD17_028]|uniref:hypothetical protein n=1 Tax=Curtobacterium sp. MCBD17_028 TaxID=2175670 RepID=UPI0011B6C638|nr:hypothetical protein [Curtobacterium sp. MCBD17_028]
MSESPSWPDPTSPRPSPPRWLANRPVFALWVLTLGLVVTAVVFWVRSYDEVHGFGGFDAFSLTTSAVHLGVGTVFFGLAVATATVTLVLHTLGHRLVVPNPDAPDSVS